MKQELVDFGDKAFALPVGHHPNRDIRKYHQTSRDHKPHLLAGAVAPPALPRTEQKQATSKQRDG